MSDFPLDIKAVQNKLRQMLVEKSKDVSFKEDTRLVCLELSKTITVSDQLLASYDGPDGLLEFVDRETGILSEFEESVVSEIVKELDL